jgi:putative hemolysin
MKDIVDQSSISEVIRLKFPGKNFVSKMLYNFLQLNKLNKLYKEYNQYQGIDFVDKVLERLEVKAVITEKDLNKIPKEGPFIIVANHPYGGIDGLLMLQQIIKVRPDFKVLANFLLHKIDNIQDFFIPVNPFENHKQKSNFEGARKAFEHLKNGHPIGIFPAGEVSTYQSEKNQITDKKWLDSAMKFVKRSKVPVVPMYFKGRNSKMFHILGKIHPSLRTVKLPSELLNKKNKKIKIRIATPIPVIHQKEFHELETYARFLRTKTYLLGSSIDVVKLFRRKLRTTPKEIISPINVDILSHEIEIAKQKYNLFDTGDYSVLCSPSYDIPNVLNEIGRLREITYRSIGEGTNNSSDLDQFDLYYFHLIIWNNREKEIVGAYRIGKGKDIIKQFGIRGFYSRSLFRIKEEFIPTLQESLELGRSFIVEKYQKSPISLKLLWKGIFAFMLKNPEYRYLYGPVTISGELKNYSKSLIVDYIRTNYWDDELSAYIKPKNRFVSKKSKYIDNEFILKYSKSIKNLDNYVKEIEPFYSVPILFKKYIQLNAKFLGFNLDQNFNNCLDGLILVDYYNIPYEILSSLSKHEKSKVSKIDGLNQVG